MDITPAPTNNPIPGATLTPGAGPTPAPQPVPPPPAHVKKAHRFLLLYVFILLAALLAGGVYAWQNGMVKDRTTKLNQAKAQITTLESQLAAAEASTPSNSNAGDAPNNPYAGQKTFCDDLSSVCLRYPKDWAITGSTGTGKTTETFTNATSSAVVSYDNPYPADKPEQVYFIASLDSLTIKSLGQKVVGRVLGSTPEYALVDSSYLTANRIATGQTVSFVNTAVFSTNIKKVTARLKSAPTGAALANIKTANQASAWFKTTDAKAALKILQSLYYQ